MTERTDAAAPSTPSATAALAQSHPGDASGAPPSGPDAPVSDDEPGFWLGRGVARAARAVMYERQAGDPLYRPLWIYTLDPAASRMEGATAVINVPYEPLEPGPAGSVFVVIPEDADTGERYVPLKPNEEAVLLQNGRLPSPVDPRFHQQMVYAVCSSVYAAFRRALGREITWGFERSRDNPSLEGRLLLYPHGGERRNAWYDPSDGSLRFGYYRADDEVGGRNVPGGFIFTCLSHDVVVHEITHALLDGLRSRFTVPTSPDVLGFHEGFADIISFFQRLSYSQVVRSAIERWQGSIGKMAVLIGLARQFGDTSGRGGPLRTVIDVDDDGQVIPRVYDKDAEEHEMGKVFLSAVVDAFFTVYKRKTVRYVRLGTGGTGVLPPHTLPADLQSVLAEELSQLASQFLSICIRAVDYCPPVDLELGEFLRAVITADYELVPDDPWGYREAWIEAFARHGIYPPQVRSLAEDELRWQPPSEKIDATFDLSFAKLQFRGDPSRPADEVELERQARAIGKIAVQHSALFGLVHSARGEHGAEVPMVQSVRSCRRVGPDGQVVFDLVAEITQERIVRDPRGDFAAYGGATVLFGPNGEIRFIIAKSVMNERRTKRQGGFVHGRSRSFWQEGANGWLVPTANFFRMVHDRVQHARAEDRKRGRGSQ